MESLLIGFFGLGLLITLLILGVPVGVSMVVAGIAGFAVLTNNVQGSLNLMATTPYAVVALFGFTTVPLFLLMGHFATIGKLGDDIYDAAHKWLGRLPGGMGIATTFAAALFGAACGASIASAATFTKISLPQMLNHGYDRALASGCIAAAGTLAIMIPPSGAMVIYGLITNTSIGQLLVAGVIPGVMSAFIYVGVLFLRVQRNPHLAPISALHFTLKQKMVSLKGVWGILVLVVLVMGGIYTGIVTPTEAAALGALGAFLIAAFRRGGLKGGALEQALSETAKTTAMIFIMIIGAIVFGRFLAVTRLSPMFAEFVARLSIPPITVIIAFMLLYVFLGCFLEGVAMQTLTLPVLFPVVTALGYSPVWFGVLVVKTIEIAMLTPPVGLNCFVVSSIGKVKLEEVFRGVTPFIIGDCFSLILLLVFPAISLWLPGQMM